MLIKLINMPFADVNIPSIALPQLRSVITSAFGGKVKSDIHYLNHDFVNYLLPRHYNYISNSKNSNNSGFGDWFFSAAAFPERTDNTAEYIERYQYILGVSYLEKFGGFLQQKRLGIPAFLDTLIDEYHLLDADIVGLTSMFMQNAANLALARRIKDRKREVIIVMGGANCETVMGREMSKRFDVIDYTFSGPALMSFQKFVGSLLEEPRRSPKGIRGVFAKAKAIAVDALGEMMSDDIADTAESFENSALIGEELPIQACVSLDYDSFLESHEKFFKAPAAGVALLFETSRGCWWGEKAHCTFCGLNGTGMSYRAMTSDSALQHINEIIDRYGDRVKYYSCVDNIMPREYIPGIFAKISLRPDITIFYEVKADLTAEDMEILSKAQVKEIQPGIEALATSTLKLMRKGTSVFGNIRFLQNSRIYGIRIGWNLLIGFPGEEESVYEKYYRDIPLLHHLQPPSGVFSVRFDRYSPYFTHPEKYHLDLHPLDYYSFVYPFDEGVISRIAYFFSDHNFDAPYIINSSKWLTRLEQRIQAWKELWSAAPNGYPKLHFSATDGHPGVVDSRSGESKTISISDTEYNILIGFDQKKNISGLASQLTGISLENIEQGIKRLQNLGFLFEENGTYMNLVFKQDPLN